MNLLTFTTQCLASTFLASLSLYGLYPSLRDHVTTYMHPLPPFFFPSLNDIVLLSFPKWSLETPAEVTHDLSGLIHFCVSSLCINTDTWNIFLINTWALVRDESFYSLHSLNPQDFNLVCWRFGTVLWEFGLGSLRFAGRGAEKMKKERSPWVFSFALG